MAVPAAVMPDPVGQELCGVHGARPDAENSAAASHDPLAVHARSRVAMHDVVSSCVAALQAPVHVRHGDLSVVLLNVLPALQGEQPVSAPAVPTDDCP